MSAAARQLGISRATLYSKIRKNKIVLRKGALLDGGTPRPQ
ncbi:MAG: helix-turn-helix domain-containing protein [Desulfotomaculales bacterium]